MRKTTLVWALLALAAAAAAPGCDEETNLPPPRTAPSTSASTGSGGDGGAGGATWANLCECLADIDPAGNNDCFHCFVQLPGLGECQEEAMACDQDVTCQEIRTCMGQCNYTVGCINYCALPFEGSEGHQLYAAMMTCGCTYCRAECVYAEPLKCDGTDGGSGGAGGAGGQGGS